MSTEFEDASYSHWEPHDHECTSESELKFRAALLTHRCLSRVQFPVHKMSIFCKSTGCNLVTTSYYNYLYFDRARDEFIVDLFHLVRISYLTSNKEH
jgi:hypothetical protein